MFGGHVEKIGLVVQGFPDVTVGMGSYRSEVVGLDIVICFSREAINDVYTGYRIL